MISCAVQHGLEMLNVLLLLQAGRTYYSTRLKWACTLIHTHFVQTHIHIQTHTHTHACAHTHRFDCIYAKFINNGRYLSGQRPAQGSKLSHPRANPLTLCVHARPQSPSNLTIHQRLTCYSLTTPFPSSHPVITTEALDLCQKCINNFHSNILAVQIQASISAVCEDFLRSNQSRVDVCSLSFLAKRKDSDHPCSTLLHNGLPPLLQHKRTALLKLRWQSITFTKPELLVL